MPPAPSEITRDELLATLRQEDLRVSIHQLLRWHDWGLLPPPRREGLGRGKGSISYYSRMAGLQARTLARLLTKQRSLVEAGWGLWALGFPVTAWARDLLLDELKDLRRGLSRADKSLRREKGQVARLARQRRAPRALAKMRNVVTADQMPRVLQMITGYQLGTLEAETYTAKDWETFQDAALSEYWPALLDHSDLLGPTEVATLMAQFSLNANLPKTIAALEAVSDQRLEQYRNELQWLTEVFAPSGEWPTPVMARPDFLTFFKARHMSPEGDRIIGHWMKALGRTHPPFSTLHRWLIGLREHMDKHSSTTTGRLHD